MVKLISACMQSFNFSIEVSAILVRFVYLDTRKRTTVGLTYIWAMENRKGPYGDFEKNP